MADINWSFPYRPTRNNLRAIIVTFPDGHEKEFDCIRAATAETGIPHFRIRECIRHDHDYKGFTFRDAKP